MGVPKNERKESIPHKECSTSNQEYAIAMKK